VWVGLVAEETVLAAIMVKVTLVRPTQAAAAAAVTTRDRVGPAGQVS